MLRILKKINVIILSILMVCIVGQHDIIAQAKWITITDHKMEEANISASTLIYEDPSGLLTLEDIIKGDQIVFNSSTEPVPNFGVTKSTIWARLDIMHKVRGDFKLAIAFPNLDSVTFYYPYQGRYESKNTGWSFPLKEWEVKSPDLIFPLPDAPLDTVLQYYIKAKSRIVILPFALGSSDSIHSTQQVNALYYLFYLGMVAMLFFYNFSIYVTSKEIQYLYYSTWVFFATLFFLIIKGYSRLIIPEQFNFILRHTNIISSLGGLSILLFVESTLRLKEFLPKIIKWYNIGLGLYVLIIISSLLRQFQLASNLSQLVLMYTVILGLISGIRIYRKGHSFAKYYLYGFIVTLISMTIYILIFQKVVPFNLFTSNSIVVGSAIEMILFSFGLGAKIQTINKEKQEAQAVAFNALKDNEQLIYQQNISLESKVEERTRELTLEKQKSDDLLLNILPAEVAHELREDGVSEAKNYNNVSVLFTDFVNFTGISETLTPQELVSELHICFKGIDEIIEKYKLEKIKTIGDAYLAVCGLPLKCDTHAINTIQAAKAVLEFIESRKKAGGLFDIRIGIHSGPVIAGIVGIKKFAYDIWGDTVNTAARMEQNSEAGKINISGATWELVKHQYVTIHRGKIAAKNKGDIDMYFVS